jgi:hypothetical protein
MSGSAPAPAPAEAAGHLARAILSEGRFHQPSVPRPLHGVLSAIGEAVRAPFDALNNAVVALGARVPGGVVGVWGALAILVLCVTWVLAMRRSRLTLTSDRGPGDARSGELVERVPDLIAAAEAAERAGRLADAVRLRFRAGLQRLAERGTIATAQSTPTSEVSLTLHSPRFDELARRFDEIAYGDSPPAVDDVEAARREWPAVLSGSDKG